MGKSSFVRSAGIVSACTLLSRVLGLVRDVLCAHFFGASLVFDAFWLAYRVPNLFRRLFGEGALSAAFLPAFVERLEGDRPSEAHALLSRLVTAMALGLGLLVAAGIGLTFLLPDDPKAALFAELLRIMLPYLALICIAAILGAALNGMRLYFAPAFAPVLLNVAWIATLFLFTGSIRAVAWAIVIGGVLQILVMLPALLGRGVTFRPRLDLRDPALREVGGRFVPMLFGLALVQVNEFLGSVIAEVFVPGDGAVSALGYGNQLTQLPLALIGSAMATAVFPLFASPREDLGRIFSRSMRLVLFLSVPASVGLLLLSRPIIALLYEHGAFTPEATARAAGVTFYQALGLWCYCANMLQVRAFYARKDTRTPVRVSATMVILNIGAALALVGPMGERGIALAGAASGFGSFITLQVLLRRRIAELASAPVFAGVWKTAVASALMGAAAFGVHRLMQDFGGGRLVVALVPVAAGAAAYFVIALALRMDEPRLLLRRSHEDR